MLYKDFSVKNWGVRLGLTALLTFFSPSKTVTNETIENHTPRNTYARILNHYIETEQPLFTFFEYENKYKDDERIVFKINEMRNKLVERGRDPVKTNYLFMDPSISIDDRIIGVYERAAQARKEGRRMSYDEYRERIRLDSLKTKAPLVFEEHAEALLAAQNEYGVDYRYIVGILGVESRYGEYLGEYNLVDALVTHYAALNNKTFGLREMSPLINHADKKGIDLQELNKIPSSYAGAIGIAQWMPATLNSGLFIGKNNDPLSADIWRFEDAIPSIANYLKRNNGWHKGKRVRANWNPAFNGESVRFQLRNWFALWAYNRSDFYIRAVTEIAEELEWLTPNDIKKILRPMYAEEDTKKEYRPFLATEQQVSE